MRKYIAIMAAAAALAAPAQNTTKLSATKANDYGIIYAIPTTVLDITIETEYTEKQPGEFYNYANLALSVKDGIIKPSQSAKVKSITIVPRGVANKENEWMMQFKGGQSVTVLLDDAGVPIAINTDDAALPKAPTLPVAKEAEPSPLETPAARQAITQEMTLSSSMPKKAQLAADRIFELRSQRNDLISGQADNTPPDGKAMQLALDNLADQEAALMAMFVGTTKRWTEVNTITYTPDTTDVRDAVIARLSPVDGIVDASDLSGAPIYLTMKVLVKGEIEKDEKGNPKPFPKNGVAYQIPGSAQFTITYDGQQLASKQLEVSQLGVTYGLDPKLFTDKKFPSYVTFNPATGGITSFGTLE